MSHLKPIILYGLHGPNAAKVFVLLEELKLPYEIDDVPIKNTKIPRFVAINPNGRLPAIKDPNNNDIIIWESGAILEYLTEQYDKEHALSFELGTADFYHARQWLFFQTTGQGPYYGQAMWFIYFQKLQEPAERYVKEVNRVTGVIEGHLGKQQKDGDGKTWFQGGRFSYVDIAFFSWQNNAALGIPDFDQSKYPLVQAWLDQMRERESVQKILELQKPKE